jgi:type I restriction enzyme R subunit
LLTDIISLIRYALGQTTELVNERFKRWISKQEDLGREFTPQQMEWLTMIKDHIATSLSVSTDDFEYVPFADKGGAVKAYQLFGDELNKILNELAEQLV